MGYPTMHLSPHTSSKSPECFPDSQITTTKSLLVCFFALPFPPALGVCGKWRQKTIDYIWRIASFSRSINSTNLFTLWKVLKALNGYCIWHILLWHMREVVVFLPEKLLFFYKVKYVTWQLAYTTHCQLNLSNMWHSGKACWQTTKTEFFLPVIYLDASKFNMCRVFPGYILQHSSDMISISFNLHSWQVKLHYTSFRSSDPLYFKSSLVMLFLQHFLVIYYYFYLLVLALSFVSLTDALPWSCISHTRDKISHNCPSFQTTEDIQPTISYSD